MKCSYLLSETAVSCVFCCLTAVGQTNFWYWETSAPWESPYWSLGVLPGPEQTVAIPNPGYKAVAINWLTVANHPESLTISNLHVSAPDASFSTLLLNYSGTNVPLHIRNSCTVGRHGMLMNLHSGLEVGENGTGQLLIYPGTFVQEGGYTVATNARTYVLQGSMNLTNAVLDLGDVQLGMYNQSNSSGKISLSGGHFRGHVDIRNGLFDLHDGVLAGSLGVGNLGYGEFNQYGGTNHAGMYLGGTCYEEPNYGVYRLHNGMVDVSKIYAGTGPYVRGRFEQWGGRVRTGELWIGGDELASGSYILQHGELLVDRLFLGNGSMKVAGGAITVSNAPDLCGSINPRSGRQATPRVSLSGGALSTTGFTIRQFASFVQTGGTNEIAGTLGIYTFDAGLMGPAAYGLRGGLLRTCTTRVFCDGMTRATFTQTGGTHIATVAISNYGTYTLSSGTLVTPLIVNGGDLILTNFPNEPVFVNDLLEMRGTLSFNSNSQKMGRVQLSMASQIAFGPGAGTLAFADSSAIPWGPTSLVIRNWRGSPSGSGAQRLVFGNSAAALTPKQLRSIWFQDPAGLKTMINHSRILPDGEVVPVLPEPLVWFRAGTSLVLSWPQASGWTLQIATNIVGPFQDVPYAVSPYTNDIADEPRRFFRLIFR